MTDRELLEAAAKAVGAELEEADGVLYAWRSLVHKREWNPLKDDGDALRLAVACGLVVDCSRPSAGEPFKSHRYEQEGARDARAATRRAIVRAAAAIGAAK